MIKVVDQTATKANKVFFLLSMIVILSLLAGCVLFDWRGTSTNTYSETQVAITYSEENSQYSIRKDMLYTETDLASYYFEQIIDKSLRQACIEATDRIIENLGSYESKPEIYVFDAFDGVNIMANTLYTSKVGWQSVDYVTDIILATYGECTHYGLAYGYAVTLCEEFGWEVPESTDRSAPETMDVYDLNVLCFDRSFVSEKDILVAQQTAYRFVDYLLETYGEETVQQLLSLSHTEDGMTALCEKLREFYAVQGVDYSPSHLRFGYGGVSYTYVLRSHFGTFYIGTDWTDANAALNPLVTENFLHSNYAETKAFFERNLEQMQSYQELFGLGDYDNELTVIFPNSRSGSQYSYYQSGLHRIIVYNVDSLMHEYIHALTKPSTSQKLWETEGFARYFSYYYDDYGIAFLNEDYNSTAQSKATEYLFEFKQTIDRPVDMQIDFKELENVAVYSRNYTDPNASYVAGSSFVQYLVEKYGEAAVVQCIYGEEKLPKPYSELVEEWNRYIEETYCDFSRYSS